jgi:hypothetical protein
MSQVKISHAINGNLPFKNQRAYDHLAQKANSDQYTREWQGKILLYRTYFFKTLEFIISPHLFAAQLLKDSVNSMKWMAA